MKKCPNGAIVNSDELTVIAASLTLAIELIDMDIDSNTRPSKASHDDEYRQQMKVWKESRNDYRKLLRKVIKVKP
jgi:hypothetical protein